MTSLPNGTVVMNWQLPSEFRDIIGLAIDVNWGLGWISISEGFHASSFFDPLKQYEVTFRLHHGDWEGFVYVTIPPMSPKEGEEKVDLVLIYCVIFGSLLVSCAVLAGIILGFKFVQWSRRGKDKSKLF